MVKPAPVVRAALAAVAFAGLFACGGESSDHDHHDHNHDHDHHHAVPGDHDQAKVPGHEHHDRNHDLGGGIDP